MIPLTQFLTRLRKRNIRLWLEKGDLCYSAPKGAFTPALFAELKRRKPDVVHFLTNAQREQAQTITPQLRDGRLSFAQERLWFLDQLEPGNPFYNVAIALRLDGTLVVEALEQSLALIVARHEILRTRFPLVEGEGRQVVSAELTIPLVKLDLSDLPPDQQAKKCEQLTHTEAQTPFDLAHDPLLRTTLITLNEQSHLVLMTMHHIISDGWSLGVLVQEIGTAYQAALSGQADQLPPLPIQYADFSVWQRAYLEGAHKTRQLNYWVENLAGARPELNLPTDRPRPAVQSFAGSSEQFVIDATVVRQLNALSQQTGATLFMTLSAALFVLLHRQTAQDDILLGTPIANRTRPELEKLIGFFVNTLVLRADLSDNPTFSDLLRQVRQTALNAYAHQDLPFEVLVDAIQPERDLSRNPLFQVMFALQNAPVDQLTLPALEVSVLEAKRVTALFDLVLDMWETPQGLIGVLEYSTDLFDRTTIERFISHFQTILSAIAANPHQPIAQLPLLTEAEKHRLLVEFSGEKIDTYPLDQTLHGLFEAQVKQSPDRVAAVDATGQISYSDLNTRANHIAHQLRATGLDCNQFVAILDERGIDFLASILGILKAGGAYLPIDPSYPTERIQYMLTNSQTERVITRAAYMVDVVWTETNVTHLLTHDDTPTPAGIAVQSVYAAVSANPAPLATARDSAYMLYTSGSTGLPKGAIIRHDGAINHIYGEFEWMAFHADSAFLQSAPSSSDISVWQFLGPLLCGGRSVIVDLDIVADPPRLFERIRETKISVIELVPVVLKGLLDHVAQLPDGAGTLPDLEWAMVTGEAVTPPLINQWIATYPDIAIINAYGPTEAADDVTQHAITTPLLLDGRPVPVGKPLPNLQIYIIDSYDQLAPIGVAGEICVGGIGVGKGYWRNQEKTEKAFISAENLLPPDAPNRTGKIYRTGDLGRWLADGTLECIGRIDQQVKLRGFRIELGEIEGLLDQHRAIDKSVAAIHSDATDEKRLIGYVTVSPEAQVDDSLEDQQVILWRDLHEQSYSDVLYLDDDPTVNVIGWDSNYTNQPLSPAELHEYIDGTVQRALALRPDHVLEIGCGTGMLAFPLIEQVSVYRGTDISAVAIKQLQELQTQPEIMARFSEGAEAVFEVRSAENFDDLTPVDLVMLPSVVQYFPSADYLLTVLTGLSELVADGGVIYVGDVRNRFLLEAFHASVQQFKADETVTAATLKQRVWQQLQQEQEMAIDPAFFVAVAAKLPRITHLRILPKRGHLQNEMTRFRYDVLFYVAGELPVDIACIWSEFSAENDPLATLERDLKTGVPFGVTRLPNERVAHEKHLLDWLTAGSTRETNAQFSARQTTATAIDPETIWALAAEHNYHVELSMACSDESGCYDALFVPLSLWDGMARMPLPTADRAWWQYTNNPLREKLTRQLVPQWREFLKERVPNHMIPNQFVLLDALPLTPNGKIDRSNLPEPDTTRRLSSAGYIAPRTPLEETLCMIWQDVLGVEQVGVQDNFFDLGGHSLRATQVTSRIQRDLNQEVSLRVLFNRPILADLAAALNTNTATFQPIPQTPIADDYPLSHAQHRLWVLAQMGGGLTAYNMPMALQWDGVLDTVALKVAFTQLVERHEILRTTFVLVDGEPRQKVHESLPLAWEEMAGNSAEMSTLAHTLSVADATAPFDLTEGPLLRVTLLRVAADQHILLFNIHHIISDAWSETVLMRELNHLYTAAQQGYAATLPPLTLQYRDYAVWQQTFLAGESAEIDRTYWHEKLAGELPILDIPTDYVRPAVKSYNGSSVTQLLDAESTNKLKQVSRQHNTTPFTTLTALVNLWLYRYTGQTDLVLGTTAHGREHPDLANQLGFYINTLLLRSEVDGQLPFTDFLQTVKQTTTDAFEHQAYPFDKLIQELNLRRDVSRNPGFDVAIVYQSFESDSADFSDAQITPFQTEYSGSKFDLSFTFTPVGETLQLDLIYNSDLYKRERMERAALQFATLLQHACANPTRPLDQLTLVSKAEQAQIEAFSPPPLASEFSTLTHQFVQQVERTPHAPAVTFESETLTYLQLDQRSNQLARVLVGRGIRPNTLVGLYLERSLDLVVAILGILKAGGAYLPIDPHVPQERAAFMLADAAAEWVVTHSEIVEKLGDVNAICLDHAASELATQATDAPPVEIDPENLAYLIYTSGSTGQPKGAMVTHGNVTRLFSSTDAWYNFSNDDVWTLFHSYAFDFSVWEIWGALLYGGRVVVVPYTISRQPSAFFDLLVRENVTVLNQTPSAFSSLIEVANQPTALRYVIFGGEALDVQALAPWFERYGDSQPQLVNMYGITETTVHVTYRPITQADLAQRSSVIGQPIPDLQLVILDQNGRTTPIGVAGELYVGGAGVALGYWQRPALTAARFVDLQGKGDGSRWYRTGDLAAWLPDGDIAYLGRIDSQVKIRGFRIELGEIEAVLANHPAVKTAIVVTRSDQYGVQLVAYVVVDSAEITSELAQLAAQKLPDYMCPAHIIPLQTLPLTANGKLDRKALPDPRSAATTPTTAAPTTTLQTTIAAIWRDVLGVAQIGIHDNFFDSGGDSLRIIQVQKRLTETLEREIEVVLLFQYATIATLAQQLEQSVPQEDRTTSAQARVDKQKSARKRRRNRR